MPIINRQDAAEVDDYIARFFASSSAGRAQALRRLFVEKLDFAGATGAVSLANAPRNVALPPHAERIASMEGLHVVYVPLYAPGPDRVRKAEASAAAKLIADALHGDLLLVMTNPSGSQLHFIYPSFIGVAPSLRRMIIERDLPRRTAVQQFSNIFWQWKDTGSIRMAVDRAFDVEAVTKQFFAKYKSVFEGVMAAVNGFGMSEAEQEANKLFVQTLFNRLMFIYFLSRKGWLRFKGDPDYLNALRKDAQARDKGRNFYDERLRNLFFAGLNNDASRDVRSPILASLIGDVPFLNGGLFEETPDDKRPNILVPDAAIDQILRELFDKFNFTVMESTPFDVEVAVDPEMLGKVFEELVTGRHEYGSYYTPRPVVAFMCREALKGYLMTKVERLSPDAIARFIDEHDVSRLGVTEAAEVSKALDEVTVVDPACGSGAYLLGMLHELIELQQALYSERLNRDPNQLYDMKLHIIERNLYGADSDAFAVNIAMLRLWLSLIIDFEGETPLPLPNLDFKIACGDSLTAPNPQVTSDLFRHAAHEAASRLAELKGRYLREPGPEKQQLRTEIQNAERDLQRALADSPAAKESVDWRIDFAEVFESREGFDIALANPPYGARINDNVRDLYFDRATEGPQSKDTYGLFMARALQLICPKGQFCYIVSDTWRTIKSHRPLRARLLSETTVQHVLDLPSWIFQATVNTCILTLTRTNAPSEHRLIAGDLRGITRGDWKSLEDNLRAVAAHGDDTRNLHFARYTYEQSVIATYDNLSFFIGSSALYQLMSNRRFTHFRDIAEVKAGLQTGDNEYYLRKRPEARGSYDVLDQSRLLNDDEISNLTEVEKRNGVDPTKYGGRHFVPYDKGGESEPKGGWLPNYCVPTQYFIDWSRAAVQRIKTVRSDKQDGKIASRFQNAAYYFRRGITFSDTGFYAPTFRLGSSSVFDVMGMTIFSEALPADWLLGILSSRMIRYIIKNYINHTVHTQVEGLKPIPIVRPDNGNGAQLRQLVGEIIRKQQVYPRYPYHLHEQREIDALVYELYGLTEDERTEVEIWYARRYPRLAAAETPEYQRVEKLTPFLEGLSPAEKRALERALGRS